VLLEAEGDPKAPEPRIASAQPGSGARVAVPLDYQALRSKDRALGRRWRECVAEVFRSCFERGLEGVWMSKDGVYGFDFPDATA
jgi:hypothetical protein